MLKIMGGNVMSEIVIRDAVTEDAARLLEIYSYYVEHTAITFECTVPSLAEFSERIAHTKARYPYLVIERDGKVEGYAYAGAFNPRAAYDWSCELTVYLDPNARGGGLGRKIYTALEERLRQMGIVNLYACIAVPEQNDEYLTHNSEEFHAHLGFATVGTFRNCGRKFGRWYHMIWMEKLLAPHSADQPPVQFGGCWA